MKNKLKTYNSTSKIRLYANSGARRKMKCRAMRPGGTYKKSGLPYKPAVMSVTEVEFHILTKEERNDKCSLYEYAL